MPNPITGAPVPDPGLPAALRDLAAILTPGSVISGRILAALDNGNYAVQVRGRSLVVQSGIPLTKGEVVQIQISNVGDQIRARLLTTDAATASSANRLQALGLPNTPAGMLVLTAFERLGAPLTPDRLQTAAAQVEDAFDWPVAPQKTVTGGERLPPPPERLADAFALLARANLPTSAPLLTLALRAAQGGLPNTAAALADLRQVATTAGAIALPPVPATTAPLPGVFQPAAVMPQAAAPSATVAGPMPAAPPANLPANISGGPVLPTVVTAPATSTQIPNTAPASLVAPGVTAGNMPVPGVPSAATTAAAPTTPAIIPPPPSSTSATPPVPPTISAPVMNTAPSTPLVPPAIPAAITVVPFQTAGTSEASATVTWRLVLGEPPPDALRDGAAGIMRALTLAGVRVKADAGATATASASTTPTTTGTAEEPAATTSTPLMRQLLGLMPIAGSDQPAAGRSQEAPPPLPAPVTEAAIRTAHEQAAQSVFPPDDLADYDRVFGLPLMADGRPVPARVAVANRTAPGGGEATFLRVDTELSHLGTVSIRLSGIEGGAMAITLVAGDAAAHVLAEGLPDLAEDLRRLGLTAGLRVVGDDGIEHGGATSHDG